MIRGEPATTPHNDPTRMHDKGARQPRAGLQRCCGGSAAAGGIAAVLRRYCGGIAAVLRRIGGKKGQKNTDRDVSSRSVFAWCE